MSVSSQVSKPSLLPIEPSAAVVGKLPILLLLRQLFLDIADFVHTAHQFRQLITDLQQERLLCLKVGVLR